eukprot:Phypoly_transcript_09623.p2 GENE.Phypoly_transcript_09623~~Phypoly_transcript_09623.p2  ORF type:complete len:189 (-),score=28.05 Phypoly_transcript_09623:74-640(-)
MKIFSSAFLCPCASCVAVVLRELLKTITMQRSSRLLLSGFPRVSPSSVSPLIIAPRLALSQSVRASSTSATAHEHTKPTTQWSSQYKIYHYSSYAMLGLLPAGLLLAPSPYAMPIDLALNVVIPVHMYYGLDAILQDYIYGASSRYIGKAVVLVLSILTALGLSKINLKDVGISQGLKLMWKESPKHN